MLAYVRQRYTTKWHKNILSGHEWLVNTPIKKWEVGGCCSTESFHNIKAAQEHCDFMNKVFAGAFQ